MEQRQRAAGPVLTTKAGILFAQRAQTGNGGGGGGGDRENAQHSADNGNQTDRTVGIGGGQDKHYRCR